MLGEQPSTATRLFHVFEIPRKFQPLFDAMVTGEERLIGGLFRLEL